LRPRNVGFPDVAHTPSRIPLDNGVVFIHSSETGCTIS
jgi:hypothetical protein